jgi:hypothetical protein
MTKVHQALLLCSSALIGLSIVPEAEAQSAVLSAHPRIWLDAATRSGIVAQAGVAGSPVARASRRCVAAQQDPADYAEGGWQGFEFVITLSSCLTSYVATGDAGALATSIKYWKVLLDDYEQVGDGLGGESVVTHDTGYAMRTFAPFSALAYDWLHDAPGVTEELRAHARARFHAWSTYYSSQGYLRDLPGANYHAGYAFAATLMAIAEAGEAGAAGDAHLAQVRDVIWQKDLVPAFAEGKVLDGGDWPEGWQYGSLSVLELALAARALQANGLSIGGAASWASSLPLRFVHGLTPTSRQSFAGGDSDAPQPYRSPDNGALLATLAGPASAEAKALARKLNSELDLHNENPLFDALGAAASGEPAALRPDAATNYLARGTGNWYVRGAWTADTSWAVFQCSRKLVDDHQYANAGNWVLSRGGDDVVVDPSPYGSLSTLTGNAPAVDSATLPQGYSPSQGYWGEKTALLWARQSKSGIAAARCDYADQFRRSDVPSDVAQAVRDFVLVPQADGAAVVLVDRVVTGAAERALHFRIRTPAALALTNDAATGTVGSSNLSIRKLWASAGSAEVRSLPSTPECASSNHVCDASKLPSASEYRLSIPGPNALAIHLITARTGVESESQALSGPGYRGALIGRQNGKVAVIARDEGAAALGPALTYRAPAAELVHVVLDAPVDAQGRSDVTATRDGSDCVVEIRPYVGASAGFDGRPLVARVDAGCSVVDDGAQSTLGLGNPVDGGSTSTASSTNGSASLADPGASGAAVPSGPTVPSDGCSVAAAQGAAGGSRPWIFGWALGLLGLSWCRRRVSRR